jgi:hypothetical protein
MSLVIRWVICLLLSGLGAAAAPPEPLPYTQKTAYQKNKPLKFGDFTLTFLGERHVTPPQYSRGWTCYDFKVEHAGAVQTVTWSAGTGDIGPVEFQVGHQKFLLERATSDRLGKLRENELVISPARK